MIVDLNPTEAQAMVVDSVDALLDRLLPIERLRQQSAAAGAGERAAWSELSALGVFGLGVSEQLGGDGLGLPAEVLVARSLGRRCVSPTVIATMLATYVALGAGEEVLGAAFRQGRSRAAFANPVSASDAQLIDATECDWALLLGSSPALLPLRNVVGKRRPVGYLDETLLVERMTTAPVAGSLASNIDASASLLLAAYLVGIAQATVSTATAYACAREQFGQPIGAFQAIKHSCADMAVRAAGAEAQTFYAAVILDSGATDVTVDIACARWLARDAAVANSKANIQIHGAMGFTAECDAHLYLKRALAVANIGSDIGSEERQILAS